MKYFLLGLCLIGYKNNSNEENDKNLKNIYIILSKLWG